MRLAVLGWPVHHSLSPRMHGAALAALGLADWTFEPLAISPDELPGALARLRSTPWRGASVTIPHKEAAAKLLDEISPEAAAIGAVNTVVAEGGRLMGHNTDWQGFLDAVGEVRGKICAVLGAGGSARAIAYALRSGGAREIRAVSRRALALPGADQALAWTAEALDGADLVVGCVPPQAKPPPLDRLAAGARIFDLVYYEESALLAAARARGLWMQAGGEMLVRQGAHAFELWTGQPAPLDIMRAAVKGT